MELKFIRRRATVLIPLAVLAAWGLKLLEAAAAEPRSFGAATFVGTIAGVLWPILAGCAGCAVLVAIWPALPTRLNSLLGRSGTEGKPATVHSINERQPR